MTQQLNSGHAVELTDLGKLTLLIPSDGGKLKIVEIGRNNTADFINIDARSEDLVLEIPLCRPTNLSISFQSPTNKDLSIIYQTVC